MDNSSAFIHQKGLEASLKILTRWKASKVQISAILGLPYPIYQTQLSGQLSAEQAIRISHIINIHAALRTLFANDMNVYGFMTMENKSVFFGGECPLSLIESGSLEALEKVASHLNSLSLGN